MRPRQPRAGAPRRHPRPQKKPLRAPRRPGAARVIVAGLGNEHRRDDGAGPLVARLASRADPGARYAGPLGDPVDLLGVWDGADLAVVVDAVRSGARPGALSIVEVHPGHPAGGPSGVTSTHAIGLAGVVRLASAVGRAPRRVVLVGVEGEDFSAGEGLTPAVRDAIGAAVRAVLHLIGEERACA